MRIYLDHNAGSPMRPEAREAIFRLIDAEGNPSSIHHSGQRARRALEMARGRVASLVGASPRQIVFTSGGTESNNLAIFGAPRAKRIGGKIRHKIVTSQIEHSSILAAVSRLESEGFEIIRAPVDYDGRIDCDAVARAAGGETALVTLGLANSEAGTIQNVSSVADSAKKCGAIFHIDAVQAAGRIALSAEALGCDLMTLSGHKLGAPAGIGALYVRDAALIEPILSGGPQEGGLRPGAPNLFGAVAFGAAAKAVLAGFGEENARIDLLASHLLARLRESIPGLRMNGPQSNRLANTLNLTFPNVLGESMLIALDLEGVEVSMGSACAAGAVEPSHVLIAMGRSRAEARSSLRLSLGWSTRENEIERAAEIIVRVWNRVRAAEPSSESAVSESGMEAP
ncbi:MAG: cysteine desulfurase family protein [Candidatus Binataceae bacterium]